MAEDRDYVIGTDGYNLKFRRETLLNYGMNRWGLNKAFSVGKTSELIRACAPSKYEEWETYYFDSAVQRKKDGVKITHEYIKGLGQTLYIKLTEVVQNELAQITEEECIDYAYNLVINRTYEGYKTEIATVYGELANILNLKIEPAPDKWDRTYSVDFFIKINEKFIGLQIKPVSTENSLNNYQWIALNKVNHDKFEKDFGGKVFFIFSIKSGNKKRIHNIEVIQEIKEEILRLKK